MTSTVVVSVWQPGLIKAMATANGGSTVLADGEVTRACFLMARLGG
jgi:hypothetical protein